MVPLPMLLVSKIQSQTEQRSMQITIYLSGRHDQLGNILAGALPTTIKPQDRHYEGHIIVEVPDDWTVDEQGTVKAGPWQDDTGHVYPAPAVYIDTDSGFIRRGAKEIWFRIEPKGPPHYRAPIVERHIP